MLSCRQTVAAFIGDSFTDLWSLDHFSAQNLSSEAVEIEWLHLHDTLSASAPAKQPLWTLSHVRPKLQLEFIDWQSRDGRRNISQVWLPRLPPPSNDRASSQGAEGQAFKFVKARFSRLLGWLRHFHFHSLQACAFPALGAAGNLVSSCIRRALPSTNDFAGLNSRIRPRPAEISLSCSSPANLAIWLLDQRKIETTR